MRELARTAGPIAVANIAQIATLVTDSVLLGQANAPDLAAAALAVPVYLVALILLRSWSTAVQILIARAAGAGESRTRDDVLTVGLSASIGSGVLLASMITVGKTRVLTVIGQGSPAVEAGATYLALLSWALPLTGGALIYQAFFNGVGRARTTLASNLLIGSINLAAGVVLIAVLRLGVVGAGAAAVFSSAAGLGYLAWRASGLSKLGRHPSFARGHAAQAAWRLAWPETTLYLVGYTNEVIVVALVATVGELDLAAYRLLDTLTTVLYALFSAASTAVTIVLGHELGAGRVPSERREVLSAVMLGAGFAAPVALAGFFIPDRLLRLFTSDPAIADLAATASPIAVLSMLPALLTLCLGGALRAHRRNIWLMVASVISDVVALVPLAWLLGVREGFGLNGVYLAWLAFALLNFALVAARFRPLIRAASR